MSSGSRAVEWQHRGTVDEGTLFVDPGDALHSLQEVVGRKWHPIIVYHLLDGGPQGFSALKERIDDVSSKMLAESLTTLEESGIVERTLLSDQPVRVEYALTDRGEALQPVVSAMLEWGTEYGDPTGDE